MKLKNSDLVLQTIFQGKWVLNELVLELIRQVQKLGMVNKPLVGSSLGPTKVNDLKKPRKPWVIFSKLELSIGSKNLGWFNTLTKTVFKTNCCLTAEV